MPLLLRRGTESQRSGITPAEGELIYTTDSKTIYVGDGYTPGGNAISAGVSGGYTGSVGYVGSAGSQGGTLSANLNISTFNINNGTNKIVIDGSSDKITVSKLSSDDTFVGINSETIGKITIGDNTKPTQINRIWNSVTPYETIYGKNDTSGAALSKNFYVSRGSTLSPTAISSNDILHGLAAYGYDGSTFIISSALIQSVDSSSVSTGVVPGKIGFVTFGSGGLKGAAFDSNGRFSINQPTPTETLDVVGTGKFTGYVQFGSYTTTARNAITPAKGMIIYNTTADKFQGYQGSGWINLDTGSAA